MPITNSGCPYMNNGQPLILLNFGLALFDSVVGANRCAAAAADASVGIDFVDLALRDSFNGAYRLACSTCDASVSNYVSHSCKIILKILILQNYHNLFILPNNYQKNY